MIKRLFLHGIGRIHEAPDYRNAWYEVKHLAIEARGALFLGLHLLAERHAWRWNKTQREEEHAAIDYLDPPDHIVMSCMCGKEWS